MVSSRKISYFILFLILSMCIACILWHANWVLGDDCQFITTTAMGKPSRAWAGSGRFWPLGLVDYSLLTLIPWGHTITAHLLYNSIIMVASALILFFFMNRITNGKYYISLFFILILFSVSSFLQIHMSCIYPERMMFFLLSVFMFYYWKGEKYQSNKYYVFAFWAAAYVTYTKEPCFALVAIIALTNLIFQYKKLSSRDRIFNCALVINSVIYLCIYAYRWFFRCPPKEIYGGAKCLFFSGFNSIKTQFSAEPILYLLFIICAIRLYFVLVKKDREHLFLDGLLYAAIGYTSALIFICVVGNYYVFPSLVLALPSIAYWTAHWWQHNKQISITIMLLSAFLVKDSLMTSKSTVVDVWHRRETDMPVICEMVRQYQNGKKIIWFARYSHLDQREWLFDVYNDFINYYLNKKANVIKRCDNFNEISEDSLMLCPVNTGDGAISLRSNELKKVHLVASVFCINVYAHRKIKWNK